MALYVTLLSRKRALKGLTFSIWCFGYCHIQQNKFSFSWNHPQSSMSKIFQNIPFWSFQFHNKNWYSTTVTHKVKFLEIYPKNIKIVTNSVLLYTSKKYLSTCKWRWVVQPALMMLLSPPAITTLHFNITRK